MKGAGFSAWLKEQVEGSKLVSTWWESSISRDVIATLQADGTAEGNPELADALTDGAHYMGSAAGAPLGGLLTALLGFTQAAAACCLSFVVFAIAMSAIRLTLPSQQPAEQKPDIREDTLL